MFTVIPTKDYTKQFENSDEYSVAHYEIDVVPDMAVDLKVTNY